MILTIISTIQNPYQTLPAPYASKLFKYVPPPTSPLSTSDKTDDEQNASPLPTRALRVRYGRGGRVLVDRRQNLSRRPISKMARSSLFGLGDEEDKEDEPMDVDEDPEEEERKRRLDERWRYDTDDVPPVGPEGADEQDRILVDDYNPTCVHYLFISFIFSHFAFTDI